MGRFGKVCSLTALGTNLLAADITRSPLQHEIWFEKVAWSYMPCHWKGFGVLAAVILPTVAAILVSQAVLDRLGYRTVDWLPFPIFFTTALLFLLGMAKRHS
jgi:hypothetical protein